MPLACFYYYFRALAMFCSAEQAHVQELEQSTQRELQEVREKVGSELRYQTQQVVVIWGLRSEF